MVNKKSDVKAKEAFVAYLNNCGYENAKVISKPCDISAEKDGKTWFFEIKINRRPIRKLNFDTPKISSFYFYLNFTLSL